MDCSIELVIDTSALAALLFGEPEAGPWLFKGDDFSKTDLTGAPYSAKTTTA